MVVHVSSHIIFTAYLGIYMFSYVIKAAFAMRVEMEYPDIGILNCSVR